MRIDSRFSINATLALFGFTTGLLIGVFIGLSLRSVGVLAIPGADPFAHWISGRVRWREEVNIMQTHVIRLVLELVAIVLG